MPSTITCYVKLGTKPEEEEEAQSGTGNLWWKTVDNYGREGGHSSAKHLIQKGTGPYAIERQEGDRTGYASEGGVPRHKKTEEYTRRTASNDQAQTGVRKQKRLKEKTYVIRMLKYKG